MNTTHESSAAPAADTIEKLAHLELAVEEARTAADGGALIEALLALGKAHQAEGNTPRALTQIEEGLALAEQGEDAEAQARLWGYKGMLLERLGNTQFAQRAYFRSFNLAKELDHAGLQADALIQIAQLMANRGEFEKAISRFEQALALTMSMNDKTRELRLLGGLGALFLDLQSLDKALEYYVQAMHLAEQLEQSDTANSARLGVGTVMLANGEVEAAIEHFDAVLGAADAQDNAAMRLAALEMLLRASIAGDKLSMVQIYGAQVMDAARDLEHAPVELRTAERLVTYYLGNDRPAKALPVLERGRALADTLDDWLWQLKMHGLRGDAHSALEEWDAAESAYAMALHYAQFMQDAGAQTRLQGLLGAVYAEMGNMARAIEAGKASLALAQEAGDTRVVAEQSMLVAFALAETGDLAASRDHATQAARIFNELNEDTLAQKAEDLLQALAA